MSAIPMSASYRAQRAAIVRQLFVQACRLDVETFKPGNVSVASPGHGMQAAQFVASGEAAAGPLATPGTAVGTRIEGAVQASWSEAGCNTNLGIVLLAAPWAAACEVTPPGQGPQPLRDALGRVLRTLTIEDARDAYVAIALANPGGLGRSDEQDINESPTVTLLHAMTLAAQRDRIAAQYAHGFHDVFEVGLPAFLAALAAARAGQVHGLDVADPGAVRRHAMLGAWLAHLAAYPDSHIVRKHGEAVAHTVLDQARPWLARLRQGQPLVDEPGFAAWDEALKAAGLNPGTSADLAVATALVAGWTTPDALAPAPAQG